MTKILAVSFFFFFLNHSQINSRFSNEWKADAHKNLVS